MDTNILTRGAQWPCHRVDGSRAAVSFEDGETWTYDHLGSRVNAYANSLLEQGVAPGDRVSILLLNGLEYWALYLGIARIGGIAVRLNFRLAPEELSFAINDSGSGVLCFHSSFAEAIDGIRSQLPVRSFIALKNGPIPVPDWAKPWSILENGDRSEPSCQRPTGDTASMLMYTSGTTGRPKGAMWTHSNTLWFTAMQAIQWNLNKDTVAMTTGPMYHVGAVEDLSSAALAMGGQAIVLKSGGFSIRRVLEVVEHKKVTDLFLFPFMIYSLAQLDEKDAADYDLSSVKRILSGGDPLLPWAIQAMQHRYPWIELVQVYGLTEGTPIAACSTGEETLRAPESVGRPMPFTEISLRDENGKAEELGGEGEVWIRSPVVCSSYWQREEATRETFSDGWCRTGDLGRITDDGLLCISGRKKDMIRTGGENVYPAEVEDILMRHAEIREVAVISVPDERLIETVCAVVVLDNGSSLEPSAVIAHCKDYLASYKCPKHIVFRDSLPRTPSGKLLKFKLREQHQHLGKKPG